MGPPAPLPAQRPLWQRASNLAAAAALASFSFFGNPPAVGQLSANAPIHSLSPLSVGHIVPSPLGTRELSPVQGRWTGGPLVIHDNPETFSRPGILGSTIAAVPGRGDSRYDLPGEARLFSLANNRTGAAQIFSVVVKNTTDTPLSLSLRGTLYSKNITPSDQNIPVNYGQEGFRGPHAIAATSYLAAVPGQSGYLSRSATIPPGGLQVVATTQVAAGGEVFAMLDLVADDPSQTFAVASVASAQTLTRNDLAKIDQGQYPAAGISSDYAPAGENRLGRPNGVVAAGSTFEGGRTISLSAGQRTGDLIWATRFKNAGDTAEIGQIEPVLPNIEGVGPAATSADGSYGTRYRLNYTVENSGTTPLRVEVALTAPEHIGEVHRPLGGELTVPVRVDGVLRKVRVDARNEGRVVAVIEVPPGTQRPVSLELVNLGNTFPPAGIEFRAR